jgi:hypothetical protein
MLKGVLFGMFITYLNNVHIVQTLAFNHQCLWVELGIVPNDIYE